MSNRHGMSVCLAVVAIPVAVQFKRWTIYTQASDSANDTAVPIWNALTPTRG